MLIVTKSPVGLGSLFMNSVDFSKIGGSLPYLTGVTTMLCTSRELIILDKYVSLFKFLKHSILLRD